MAPYPASSTPKPMASPARNSHIPSLPQLSGVSGFSAGSTAECTVAVWLMSSPCPEEASQQVHRYVEDRPQRHHEVPVERARPRRPAPAVGEAAARGEERHDPEPRDRADDVDAVRPD